MNENFKKLANSLICIDKRLSHISVSPSVILNQTILITKHILSSRRSIYQYMKNIISYAIFTLLGLVFFIGILLRKYNHNDLSTLNIESFGIATATILATMLVLVLTLSLLPIQRATETLTLRLRRLILGDTRLNIYTFILALLAISSFVFAILNSKKHILLICLILFLCISIDFIRAHHRRVAQLMEPTYTISLLAARLSKAIMQFQKYASQHAKRAAKVAKDTSRHNDASFTPNQFENFIYNDRYYSQWYHNSIISVFDDLEEISKKAIARNDSRTARIAPHQIGNILINYLRSRHNNLLFYPIDLFNLETDGRVVLTPGYEAIKRIMESAVNAHDIHVCQSSLKSLTRVALYSTKIFPSVNIHIRSAPLTSSVIGYLASCAEYAQRKYMQDAVWDASHFLRDISLNTPQEIRSTDVHSHVINDLKILAISAYKQNETVVGQEIVNDILQILKSLLNIEHVEVHILPKRILGYFVELFPYMIYREIDHAKTQFPPYALTCENCLFNIFQQIASKISYESSEGFYKSIGRLLNVSELFHQHFYSIAQGAGQYDLQNSIAFWEISNSINNITLLFKSVIHTANSRLHIYDKKLISEVCWHLAFYWVVFDSSKTVIPEKAEDACNDSALVALNYMDIPLAGGVIEQCISNIASIIRSYQQKSNVIKPSTIANCVDALMCVRCLAFHRSHPLLSNIDDELNKIISESDEKTQNAIALRHSQLDAHIRDPNQMYSIPNHPLSLLWHMLHNTR